MSRPKGVPLSEQHRERISHSLRSSEKARRYHAEVQTGRKREPFSVEWRAKMSVSRRLQGVPKDSPEYQQELTATIKRLEANDRAKDAAKKSKEG